MTTDSEVSARLKSVFGYTEFRPLQEGIVRTVLQGKDAFVLMPTGGGKSLCYQLPALLLDGMTVVVSPLIALMKDQVDRLRAMGVAATYINSSLSVDEAGLRRAAVARGEVKLLYVAPERLVMPATLALLRHMPPALFAIDEAHCISEWGHDFRPEYRELRQLRELFPSSTFAALTATATPRVQADIVTQLGLQNAQSFRRSFNRPNLYYEVRPKRDAYDQVRAYLLEHRGESGIIYCQSRKGTESLATRLTADGFSAAAYHAGLTADVRRTIQDEFARDDLQIVVATIAFGMGIDKPDVRFVMHYDLPKNLEGYYQESGRAGRDGGPSDCILFYSYGDAAKQEHFIRQKETAAERQIATEQLRSMVKWAESRTCRRQDLLAYFDEQVEPQEGRCCDVCDHPPIVPPARGDYRGVEEVDCTIPAQMLLSCAKRTGERFGLTYLIRVLIGSRDQRIMQFGHDKLPTYGVGRDRPRGEWRTIAQELLQHGYARVDAEQYNAVKVTPLGEEVLFRGRKIALPIAQQAPAAAPPPAATSRTTAAAGHDARPQLFERLRAVRKRIADERGVAAFVVFHDSVLREMAARLPTTLDALALVRGVGGRKLEEHGAPFVAEISEYVRRTGAQPANSVPPPPVRTPRSITPTVWESVEHFKRGMRAEDVAEARGLSLSTVQDHLATAIEQGEALDLERLVPRERRQAIEAALAELGAAGLKVLRERVGEEYDYFEIRIVVAAWRAVQRNAK